MSRGDNVNEVRIGIVVFYNESDSVNFDFVIEEGYDVLLDFGSD